MQAQAQAFKKKFSSQQPVQWGGPTPTPSSSAPTPGLSGDDLPIAGSNNNRKKRPNGWFLYIFQSWIDILRLIKYLSETYSQPKETGVGMHINSQLAYLVQFIKVCYMLLFLNTFIDENDRIIMHQYV